MSYIMKGSSTESKEDRRKTYGKVGRLMTPTVRGWPEKEAIVILEEVMLENDNQEMEKKKEKLC